LVGLNFIISKKIDYIKEQNNFYKLIDINNVKKIIICVSNWIYLNGVSIDVLFITYKNNTEVKYNVNRNLINHLYIFNHKQTFYSDKSKSYIIIDYIDENQDFKK
jgi:hypothetical protein